MLFPHLICPLDALPLKRHGNSWQCHNQHGFDVAKQGYVNLLPVQHKQSKDPGDSKAMVAARRQFLSQGHYRPIASAVAEAIAANSAANAQLTIIDAGCGEGFYLSALSENLPNVKALAGVDISKWAVQAAAKQHKDITWVVGSNAKLPMADSCADYLLCMFGFPVAAEFHRVLKPNGKLMMVDPSPQHLYRLRQALYGKVKPKETSKTPQLDGFYLTTETLVEHEFSVIGAEQIQQLLLMTPHWFRATAAQREQVQQLDKITTQLSVQLRIYEKIN